MLNGLRGVGKTVLLNEFLSRVSDRGWITAKVESGASVSLPVALSQALVRGLRTATGRYSEPHMKRLMGVVKAFTVKVDPTGSVAVGIDVDPIRGVGDSGRLADDLAALFGLLGEPARHLGIDVLVLVDELQEATAKELAALNTAVHHLGQADSPLPVTLIGAGLPSLPAQLAEATSYAERLYDYRPIGLLSESASQEALVVPARKQNVVWVPEGLASAIETAQGYPYFLQSIGKHVWDNASKNPISSGDVEIGLPEARARSTMGFTGLGGSVRRRHSGTCCGLWRGSAATVPGRSQTLPRTCANPGPPTYRSLETN